MTKLSPQVLEWRQKTLERVGIAIQPNLDADQPLIFEANLALKEALSCLIEHPDYGRDHQFRERISTIYQQFGE